MYYELRIYEIVPGRMKAAVNRIAEHAAEYWKKYGLRPLLYAEPIIGQSNQLVCMFEWESLAEREAKWDHFVVDPGWLAVKNESEKDGPIVANATNMILQDIPTIPTLRHPI
jgi:hypothetical protein